MTRRPIAHLPSQGAGLGTAAPFHPKLGDLARDTARDGRIGVVVALPDEGRRTYHLCPPGGGIEWSAPADGSTLKPVPAQVTHVTPRKRGVVYDHRAQQGALPVQVHYEDGGTSEAVLVLTADDLELHSYLVALVVAQRDKARGSKL